MSKQRPPSKRSWSNGINRHLTQRAEDEKLNPGEHGGGAFFSECEVSEASLEAP